MKLFHTNKLRLVKQGLVISITMLLFNVYVIFAIQQRNLTTYQEAAHSSKILVKIEEVASKLNELESSQRGYFLTGKLEFMELYQENRALLLSRLQDLELLIAGNANHLKQLVKLRFDINHRMVLLKTNLSFKNPNSAMIVLGRQIMRNTIMRLELMKEYERARMTLRLSESQKWSEWFTFAIIAALVFTMLLVILGYFILTREYSLKVKTEKQLWQYQRQLKEKIDELDLSNKKLEQFAYIASHDLQEPLRKITSFSDRISEKWANSIPPDVMGYLHRISTAAGRMRVLIDDLLMYSKLNRSGIIQRPVDLESILTIVKETHEMTIHKRNVQFFHNSALPTIIGDKTQMIQLFQNLVSNAIKFTNENVCPTIRISATLVQHNELLNENLLPLYKHYHKIDVSDNGIGIDEKDLERIFDVFQRLNGRSEYEGNGIGLSICRKIVENHEGYIKAGNNADAGSNFAVYLPVIDVNADITPN